MTLQKTLKDKGVNMRYHFKEILSLPISRSGATLLMLGMAFQFEAGARAETTSAIEAKELQYKAADGTKLKGFVAYPKSRKPAPAVLVVHEWWGHNDYARSRAKQLAEMGYVAMAIDMYGNGKTADHPDTAGRFSGEVMAMKDKGQSRFQAAIDVLKKDKRVDNQQLAAIGYCFGGGIVLEMARHGLDLRGVASFHGMLGTKTPAKKGDVKARLLVLQGGDDPFVPKEQVDAFQAEMKKAGARFELIEYPGAKHAFTNPDADENGKKFSIPIAYNKDADQKSWAALTTFLKEIFS